MRHCKICLQRNHFDDICAECAKEFGVEQIGWRHLAKPEQEPAWIGD